MSRDPRVDDYIANAAPFARPILRELRARVHASCPEVEESIRWGMPAFLHHGPLAGMAAFKAHCTFGFWKHELLLGTKVGSAGAMGSFGRLASEADLPGKRAFAALVKEAARLNAEGIKVPREKRGVRPAVALHPDFERALRGNAAARKSLAAMSPSCRREYAEWVAEAKRDETRARRIAQAVEQLAEGKKLHWKYERDSKKRP